MQLASQSAEARQRKSSVGFTYGRLAQMLLRVRSLLHSVTNFLLSQFCAELTRQVLRLNATPGYLFYPSLTVRLLREKSFQAVVSSVLSRQIARSWERRGQGR